MNKEGSHLIILSPDFQTSTKGIYAIGGAVSPAFIQIQEEGTFQELKHSNLIYTAINDGVRVVDHIGQQLSG